MMSDTPRTDEAIRSHYDLSQRLIDLARQLEIELAAKDKEIADIRAAVYLARDIIAAKDKELVETRERLAKAFAHITELEGLREDAERYRWITNNPGDSVSLLIDWDLDGAGSDELDAAIDQARIHPAEEQSKADETLKGD